MTVETNISSIPYPANAETFETWCLWIARYEIGDPRATFYGREGQKQSGIDVIANTGGEGRVGIQSKKREKSSDEKIRKLFEDDFNKSLLIRPPLTEFIFCTTYPDSTTLLDVAQKLQQAQHKKGRKITVTYFGYDTIQNIIRRHPKLEEEIRGLGREHKGLTQNIQQKTNQNPLTIQEVTDEPYDPIIKKYIEQSNAGKVNFAINGLLEIDRSKLPDKSKSKILATIGRMYHRLDKISEAIDFTKKAIELDEESSIGKLRKSFLSYLQKKFEDSAEQAKELFKDDDLGVKHQAAQQYLLSLAEIIDPDVDPLSFIPGDLRKTEAVCTAHVYCLDMNGKDSSDTALKYLSLHPNNLFLRVRSTQSPIIKIASKLGYTDFRYRPSDEEIKSLKKCREDLKKIWDEIKDYEADAIMPDVPINLIIANIWLNDPKTALPLSHEVVSKIPNFKDAQNLRVELLQKHGSAIDLENFINDIDDKHPLWGLCLIEKYFNEGNFEQAQKLAAKVDVESLRTDKTHTNFFTLLAELARKRKDFNLARQYLRDERTLNPKNIVPYIKEIDLIEETSDDHSQVASIIDEARRVIDDGTPIDQRAILARFFRRKNQFDEAISLLEGRISLTISSSELRLYLEILLEAGNKLKTFQTTFRKIPNDVHEELKTKPLYMQFLISVRNYAEAESFAKELASITPPQFEDKFLYARILLVNEKHEELGKYLDSLGDIPLDIPADILMSFGLLNLDFGNKKRGLNQIYACALLHHNNSQIARCYVSSIIDYENALLNYFQMDIEVVETGHAIQVRSGNESKIWVIEDNDDLRPSLSPNYVPSTSSIGKALLGKKIGDNIKFNPSALEEWSIINVQNKEIFLLHHIQEILWNKHGDVNGLQRVPTDESLPLDQRFEPLLGQLRQRNEHIQSCWEMYQSSLFPFRRFCKDIGFKVWEVYDCLHDLEGKLKVWEGGHDEFQAATAAIVKNDNKGFVADLLTYRVIYKLDLLEIVRQVLGRAYISNKSKEDVILDNLVFSGTRPLPSREIGFKDGQYFSVEYSEQDLKQRQQEKQKFKDFINKLEPIAAIGKQDISPTLNINAEPHFFDDAQAASGQDCILLSEDGIYRPVVDYEISTDQDKLLTTWIQPVLMRALEKELITKEQYFNYIRDLIKNKHHFTRIDSEFILWATVNNEISTVSIAEILITPSTDIEYSLLIIKEFLNLFWAEDITKIEHERVTFEYLNQYLKVRGYQYTKFVCEELYGYLDSEGAKDFIKHFLKRAMTLILSQKNMLRLDQKMVLRLLNSSTCLSSPQTILRNIFLMSD